VRCRQCAIPAEHAGLDPGRTQCSADHQMANDRLGRKTNAVDALDRGSITGIDLEPDLSPGISQQTYAFLHPHLRHQAAVGD